MDRGCFEINPFLDPFGCVIASHLIDCQGWRLGWALVPSVTSKLGVSFVQVLVRDNNVDQALRALKKKLQREGVFREMKLRRNFEKPCERRAREKAESVRRQRKVERKRKEREGF